MKTAETVNINSCSLQSHLNYIHELLIYWVYNFVHCCKPHVQSMEVLKNGGSTVFLSIISDTSVSV